MGYLSRRGLSYFRPHMQSRAHRSLGIGSRRLRGIIGRVPPAPDFATTRPPTRTLMRDPISGQEALEACHQALDADARSVEGSCDPGRMFPMKNSRSFPPHRPMASCSSHPPRTTSPAHGGGPPSLLDPRDLRRLLDPPAKVGVPQRLHPAPAGGEVRGPRAPGEANLFV